MKVRASLFLALALSAWVFVPGAAAEVRLTPVERMLFPERGYIIDIGRDADITKARVHVAENGTPVGRFSIRPLAASSINSAVVLAIDASDSMRGDAYRGALAGARAFIGQRTGSERIGVVAFNSKVLIVERPTLSPDELEAALADPPELAFGTHIYDAVLESLSLLAQGRTSAGAIVLLSDGADVGSSETLETTIAAARRQHIRVFTVGLRSTSYNGEPLRALADATGGSYYEAVSAADLTTVYTTLGKRLASQYLLRYRSKALPTSAVTLRVAVNGLGSTAVDYMAPKPSEIAPYHKPLLKRFLLSPLAAAVLSLFIAGLVGCFLILMLKRAQSGLVPRIEEFLHGVRTPREQLKSRGREVRAAFTGASRTQGLLGKIDHNLEIAGIEMSASRLVAWTAAVTIFTAFLLALVSPMLLLVGLLTPFLVRGLVRRRLRTVRDEFADQLPPNLQVLASALRAGHSFSGALGVVVENGEDPSRRELRRAVTDDQLGVPMDEALRRIAVRMESRDLEQVALLSELQRTAGGNAAEVLDTVVETIRERADIRRLVRTLTAQGRLARWILTAVPVFAAGFLTLIQPDVMKPLYTTTGGHVALALAGALVLAGSLVIQKIVEIEV